MLFKLLLILSLYLPFQLAFNLVPGIDLASIRILILILFFLWLAQGLKNKKIIINNNFQTIFIIIFLFLSFLSIFWAQNINWSARKLFFLFSIFPIYFIASDLARNEEKKEKLIKALVFSGTLAAILGIFQFSLQFILGLSETVKLWSYHFILPFLGNTFGKVVIKNPSWLVNIAGHTYLRSIATFPDPHMFSLFLGMLLPLAIGLALFERKKIWIAAASLIFLADVLTFSRGGYLGMVAGMLVLIFIFWDTFGKNYKITLFLTSLIIFLTLIIPNPISERFFSSFNLKEGSNAGRIVMWKKAGEVIAQHPFFGVGIGNFPLEVNPLTNYRKPIYAHNTYLDIAAEEGILASLAWIGILSSSFLIFLKRSKKNILYLSAAISLIIFSVHSIVETGLYSPIVLTLFLLIISLSNFKKDSLTKI